MTHEETIEHPALPHAGPTVIEFHPWWFWQLVGQISPVRFKVPAFGWRVLCLPFRTRMANCETWTFGPFALTRARPWLVGPARQSYPEIFITDEAKYRSALDQAFRAAGAGGIGWNQRFRAELSIRGLELVAEEPSCSSIYPGGFALQAPYPMGGDGGGWPVPSWIARRKRDEKTERT